MGVLNLDGVTPAPFCSDSTFPHFLCVADGTTGSDFGPKQAKRDENRVPTAMAVSSVDGKTPVALYIDLSNDLLIQST